MMIKDQINADLKDAMRARDKETLETLRLVTAAIKQVEVDERIIVDDSRLIIILDKMCKQRKESITQFEAASRHDLVSKEQFELDLIKKYLPDPLSSQEINEMIAKSILDNNAEKISDMGKVMAALKPLMQGRADMSQVSALIKAQLQ